MQKTIIITAVLAVIAAAILGCLVIFGVMDFDAAMPIFAKVAAVLVLFGACAAAIGMLMANKSNEET